jgi:hypothetical protein
LHKKIVYGKKDYIVKGDGPIFPSVVKKMIDHLLSANNISSLQMAVMIVVGISNFLQFDDLQGIKYESFDPKHFILTKPKYDCVQLHWKIVGKTENKPVHQYLFLKNDFIYLCPVRLILAYMYKIKICDGFMFPSEEELCHPPSNGVFLTQVDYKQMLSRFRDLYMMFVPEFMKNKVKIGIHSLKKTAVFFAVLANTNEGDIQLSARHKHLKTTQDYMEGYSALQDIFTHQGVVEEAVPKFKKVQLDMTDQIEALENIYSL